MQTSDLKMLESNLIAIYASAVTGEPYHPGYQEQSKLFRQVVRSDVKTEKELNRYFRELAEQVTFEINWNEYDRLKASLIEFNLDQEIKKMAAIFSGTLIYSLVAGGNMTEQEFNTDIGWNENSHPAIEFLRKYTIKLSGDLNKTTQDRIKQALKLSIELGESKDLASERLFNVINDAKRSAVIAHTESVRAFSQGRLEVGRQIGVTKKKWDATFNRCPICDELDGKVVGIDQLFLGTYDAPPAHPSCRCLLRLVISP